MRKERANPVFENAFGNPTAHRVSATRAPSSSLVRAQPALLGNELRMHKQHCHPHLQHGLPHEVDSLAKPSDLVPLCKCNGSQYARSTGCTDNSLLRDVRGVPQVRERYRDSCKRNQQA